MITRNTLEGYDEKSDGPKTWSTVARDMSYILLRTQSVVD